MEYFATTDIGNYRDKNEDFFYAEDSLFIVADGMGGHKAGEIASRIAVESFVNHFKSQISFLKAKIDAKDSVEDSSKHKRNLFPDKFPDKIKELLATSIKVANQEVFNLSISKNEFSGMGTTFTVAYIHDYRTYTIHVGDSRLYLKREDKLNLLTNDHTVVGKLYRNGKITYNETFAHPYRNILTNVLGVDVNLSYDLFTFELKPHDILLLCTDGLNSMLEDEVILKIINRSTNPENISKNLVKLAKKKGGFDNITVIIIKIP